ncbi:MAG: sugar phosphate isomerase/epimerase family protein [Vicinamibacterales bacterium]
MRFGISTHLYHDQRLGLGHLEAIAGHGFEAIEVFATRSHFDYHDPAAIDSLKQWLDRTGLTLHSIHAPISSRLDGATWGTAFSNASADKTARERAVAETLAALDIARKIPTAALVVHLGRPRDQAAHGENDRASASRSLEQICAASWELRLPTAVEVIDNALSEPAALVELLEGDLELPGAGACLDFGHAHLMGDLVDTIENLSGHIITTHIHDNRGTCDDHLAPFEGSIDWTSALVSMRKVGYEGTWLFELANTGDPNRVLELAVAARREFERILGEP